MKLFKIVWWSIILLLNCIGATVTSESQIFPNWLSLVLAFISFIFLLEAIYTELGPDRDS
jgi:hypothetical protein